MWLKFLFQFIFFLALALAQISFVSGLPYPFCEMNLIVMAIVLYLGFGGEKIFWWLVFAGFIFDLYSPFPFGFWLLFWPFFFLLARFLSANFFTTHSLYSFLGLGFFAALLKPILIILSVLAWNFFGHEIAYFGGWKTFLASSAIGTILDMGGIAVMFYLAAILMKRFKPVFLIKK